MQVIGCGDDNCIGKLRDIEYFFPIAETVLIGYDTDFSYTPYALY